MEDHSLDEIRKTKRTVKNNVFIKLFEDVKNVYMLYRDLHPEDTTVKESDIEIHSMDSMFINEIYNDLGFIVNEGKESKFVILVEAQSRWSNNMTLRLLLYLAETYLCNVLRTAPLPANNSFTISSICLPRPAS